MESFEFHHLLLIGRASMAIYLIHILTGSGARVILNAMLLDNIYLHVVVGCVSGIVFPVIAFKFVDRFKIKYVFSGEFAMGLLNKLVLKGRL
jgi:peptidoglycan/LPS O-acetylase OafA/YrhL